MTSTTLAIPNRRFYALLAACFLAFVVYGSLVPFSFQTLSLAEALTQFQDILRLPVRIRSRSDWVANILLMLPAGFCLLGAGSADRPRWVAALLLVPVLLLCGLTSLLTEFGQLFVPARNASLDDVAAQGCGALLGTVLWLLLGQQATDWGRLLLSPSESLRLERRLFPTYVAILLLVHVVPLNLTLSPVEVYRKYKAGLIQLVPFSLPWQNPYAYLQNRILTVLYFTILGVLLSGFPLLRSARPGQTLRALFWSFLLAGCVLVPKLFVVSRSFDVTDLLLGGLCAFAAWSLRDSLGHSLSETEEEWLSLRALLLLGWLFLVAFLTWQPFDFTEGLWERRAGEITWIPFADLWQGSELAAFENVVQKIVVYLPLGILLTSWKRHGNNHAWIWTLVVALILTSLLEAGQLGLPTRTPTLSDIYLQSAGATLGSILTRRVCRTPNS